MEEHIEPLFGSEVAHESVQITRKKIDLVYQRRKKKGRANEDQPVMLNNQGLIGNQAEKRKASIFEVSPFDPSVENHFRDMEKISVLCGEDGGLVEEAEMTRLSEMVTFLREWKHFNYKPKTIRFSSETGISQGKDKHVLGEISLSQFSSVSVPKVEALSDKTDLTPSRNDFVFYAGGSVWALDWCPKPDTKPNTLVSSEFIAVSSHPPDSGHHKLGDRLSGRGMVQIWCLLNDSVKQEDLSFLIKSQKPRGRPRKHPVGTTPANLDTKQPAEFLSIECPEVISNNVFVPKETNGQLKRPRGRPRKHPIGTTPANIDTEQPVELLAIEYPESSSNIASVANKSDSQPKRLRKQHGNQLAETTSAENIHVDENLVNSSSSKPEKSKEGSSPIKKDLLPPRIVLCLGHNGKVAWDVKWRPYGTGYSECKHRLGYLAVLLGDGSLEVWEVPSQRMLKAIYLSQEQDCIDPRFVKLKPVFRCSMLRCGDRQSIPLTLEWSTSPSHDLILAGCHDGMVALWKFSASSSSKDVRPILCFSADTSPIRTLAWAPSEGDTESANVIVTAGHEGMKFWDLRDPFRPLWDISAQRFIYSLDWLPDPRCILTSYDDGTVRILSLAKAAYDVPVTGKPFAGTQYQGLHTYTCSPFCIWSIQVSRHTGMVAYSGSNGTALYFQLTSNAVDKDRYRNQAPHFLCGSMTDEDGMLVVNTHLMNSPYPLKSSIKNSNSVKSAKEKKFHNQPLALCYDSEDGDLDEPISKLKNVKTKTLSKGKKAKEDEALSSKEHQERLEVMKDGRETETEVLPSKMVSLHRVRWNVNKGGQRWLCYGGASGIVRCQKIIPPSTKL